MILAESNRADDGVRLWVNGKLVINQWVDQGATESTATVVLQDCKKYAIKIEYYENGGDAACKLEWSGPVIARSSIPTAQLFTESDFVNVKDFSVFPNPAKDNINVTFKTGFSIGQTIVIYNVLGQELSQTTITTETNKINIPVQTLATGMYMVTLQTAGRKFAERVLITK